MSVGILIHGGAGAMRSMSAEAEAAYRKGLKVAVDAGFTVLDNGGSAREAVVAAVRSMESSTAFNAGRGSALSMGGHIEADAAVMEGTHLETGAVAAVPHLTNAVQIADAVLDRSPHCLLAGDAVHGWASAHDVPTETAPVPKARTAQWQHMRQKREKTAQAEALVSMGGTHDLGDTVGAVAYDAAGRLATAVSTGGLWLKSDGRVGDSPMVGVGLWADDQSGAACATGTGEFIIRSMLVGRIAHAMEAGHDATASARIGLDWLKNRFGDGKAGVIAMDTKGGMSAPFDTAGMGRAWRSVAQPEAVVAIWPEEPSP